MEHEATPSKLAWLLGLGGLVPFVTLAAAAWLLPAGQPESAAFALAAYGATILAFLGAVHWGLALAPGGAPAATNARLALGVAPALLGWMALLLPLGAGLALLAAGIAATFGAEWVAARRGFLPGGYLAMRRVLSLGAGGCLLLGAMAVTR